MAAIEGFEVSLSAGDLVVDHGMVDGVHVDGATLDGNGLADGLAYAVVRAGSLAIITASGLLSSDVVVASCTMATDACTLEELTGRGSDAPVSADF